MTYINDWRWVVGRKPYATLASEAYVTAINILAVEYLIKTHNQDEYGRRCEQIYKLDKDDLEELQLWLSINKHTSSLGAMITQGDYDSQREELFAFLDEKYKKEE